MPASPYRSRLVSHFLLDFVSLSVLVLFSIISFVLPSSSFACFESCAHGNYVTVHNVHDTNLSPCTVATHFVPVNCLLNFVWKTDSELCGLASRTIKMWMAAADEDSYRLSGYMLAVFYTVCTRFKSSEQQTWAFAFIRFLNTSVPIQFFAVLSPLIPSNFFSLFFRFDSLFSSNNNCTGLFFPFRYFLHHSYIWSSGGNFGSFLPSNRIENIRYPNSPHH